MTRVVIVERRVVQGRHSSLPVLRMLWYMQDIVAIAACWAHIIFILVCQNGDVGSRIRERIYLLQWKTHAIGIFMCVVVLHHTFAGLIVYVL